MTSDSETGLLRIGLTGARVHRWQAHASEATEVGHPPKSPRSLGDEGGTEALQEAGWGRPQMDW